ncbi:hypothetical protein F0L74_23590 [Chitinophaga agrisoli]|uniref:Oligosaccharide repeat unit polymerase n=1 Tax=Chitinophaga agrisoli TaxID=2607653 RepID=A0A5B2VLJ3_9BACT|nr:hypothetical protein [Chitinophaga agrisoli]KAA2239192.1 hypothetical protein F0L74_23590 [Chitinophaga agrisoli]
MNNLVFYSLNALLLGIAFWGDHEFLFRNSWCFYFIQLGLFLIHSSKSSNKSFLFLTPSFITLLYLNLNFAAGEYAISRNYGMSDTYYVAVQTARHLDYITAYFLGCNLLVYMAIPAWLIKGRKPTAPAPPPPMRWIMVSSNKGYFIISCLALLGLSFANINLSFLGGSGNFSYVFQVAIAIPLCFMLAIEGKKYRWPLYLLMIGLFLAGHYGSKREILFILILIFLAEVVRGWIRLDLSFKKWILFGVLGAGVFYIIILSSLLRGYGGYNVKGVWDATKYVSVYMNEDYFKDALVSNLEVGAVYGNSANGAGYIFDGHTRLLRGSTFAKVLFIPIPRSVYPNKPRSMVDIYTAKFVPAFRRDGGSLPIVLYGEVLWNFHLLGLPLLFLFYRYFNLWCYTAFTQLRQGVLSFRNMSAVFLFITFIQFVRGSGLDMWLLYYFVAMPAIWILYLVLKNWYFLTLKDSRQTAHSVVPLNV